MHVARSAPLAAAALTTAALAPAAAAFEIDTAVTSGCHEELAAAAITDRGFPDGATPPPSTHDDRELVEALPFSPPAALRDPWSVAVLVGVRHNDLRGANPTDLAELSLVHNDRDHQDAHCLRAPEHDFAAGDRDALGACRAFILGEIEAALGTGDRIDLAATEAVEIHLDFRGALDIELQRFGFRMGRALHTLQDAYTHSFRTPGDARVSHVLNWIDATTEDDYEVARDGYQHLSLLDECRSGDPEAQRRFALARAASEQLWAAVVAPGSRAERLERAAAVVDEHLAAADECTADNDWCDAAELELSTGPASGCAAGGGAGAAWALLPALLALGLGRARRGALIAALVLAPALAHADSDFYAPEDDSGEVALGLHAAGAVDRAAAAVGVGGSLRVSDHIGVGLAAEYNPWFAFPSLEAETGSANLYASLIWHWAEVGPWQLRSGVDAGASILLFDLVGIDRGTIGAYLGVTPVTVARDLGERWRLFVSPIGIAMPTPQLEGIPFYYHQYRFAAGVEWAL